MARSFRRLFPFIAAALVALLVLPPEAFASPRPLDAATVHARIMKRGLGNWVGVEEANGICLFGRIIAIHAEDFTMQLAPDNPNPVTIAYSSVVTLRTGPGRGFWTFMAVGFGVTAGLAIWGISNFHHQEQQIQQNPPFPALP